MVEIVIALLKEYWLSMRRWKVILDNKSTPLDIDLSQTFRFLRARWLVAKIARLGGEAHLEKEVLAHFPWSWMKKYAYDPETGEIQ